MNPIERAARDLCWAIRVDPDELVKDNPQLQTEVQPMLAPRPKLVPQWQMQLPIIRAVLAAIREPSKAMLIAGAQIRTSPERDFNDDDTLAPEWRAMIDAALAEIDRGA